MIRIRVIGFGWKDLSHPWSKNGKEYSPDELLEHLVETIIPEQQKRGIPKVPPVELPSRGIRHQLGTKSKDMDVLDQKYKELENEFVEGAHELRDELEKDGVVDRHERLQPVRPKVNEDLIDARIEQLWGFEEPDGTVVDQWCRGTIVAVKKNNKVHIKWDDECVRDGDPGVTGEILLKTKWNKHVERGWRFAIGKN